MLSLHTRGRVALHRQHVELIFCLVVTVLKQLSPAELICEVSFAHHCPADISAHLRIFGPSVHFARPESRLAFAHSYLESPIVPFDKELLGVLDRYAERLLRRIRKSRSWSAKVAELLSRNLCDGKPSLSHVANLLAVSPRTLQAKLKEESTTFQAILDNIRQQLATSYLADDTLSLTEIAFLLGYADQSAFNHAFRKWAGDTPLRFRERSQGK